MKKEKLELVYENENKTIKHFKRPDGSLDIQVHCPTEGEWENRTQQQFTDECNVVKIMEKYNYNSFPQPTQGTYQDLTAVTDYQGYLESLQKAHDAFMQYPSQISFLKDIGVNMDRKKK